MLKARYDAAKLKPKPKRRSVLLPILLIAIAALIVLVLVLRSQSESTYNDAMHAIEIHQAQAIATARAQGS